MATRYIGNCPCCEGDFKLNGGKLVHHGYLRPGDGYIHGDCFSVGLTPHETSPDTAKAYLKALKNIEANLVRALEDLPKVEMFLVEKRKVVDGRYVMMRGRYETFLFEMKKAETPKYDWDSKMRSEIHRIQSQLDMVRLDVVRVQNHVDTWVLKPIRTFEEEVEKKQAEVKARKAEKAEQKRIKAEEALARVKARYASAVRRKNLSALVGVFETVARLPQDVAESIDADGLFLKLGLRFDDRDAWKIVSNIRYGSGENPKWPF